MCKPCGGCCFSFIILYLPEFGFPGYSLYKILFTEYCNSIIYLFPYSTDICKNIYIVILEIMLNSKKFLNQTATIPFINLKRFKVFFFTAKFHLILRTEGDKVSESIFNRDISYSKLERSQSTFKLPLLE